MSNTEWEINSGHETIKCHSLRSFRFLEKVQSLVTLATQADLLLLPSFFGIFPPFGTMWILWVFCLVSPALHSPAESFHWLLTGGRKFCVGHTVTVVLVRQEPNSFWKWWASVCPVAWILTRCIQELIPLQILLINEVCYRLCYMLPKPQISLRFEGQKLKLFLLLLGIVSD